MSDTNLDELGVIKRASPCSAKWSSMEGGERVRSCGRCQRHVYKVENLTSFQVRDLVVEQEGRPCMRFFQRSDDTLLTRDCPRGIAALGWLLNREKKRKPAVRAEWGAVFFALAISLVFSVGVITLFGDNIRRLFGMTYSCHLYGVYPASHRDQPESAPPAPVAARFDASPPCPTSGAPVR